jgi:hypothetical protein
LPPCKWLVAEKPDPLAIGYIADGQIGIIRIGNIITVKTPEII